MAVGAQSHLWKGGKQQSYCKECGTAFFSWQSEHRKYCSLTCKEKAWAKLQMYKKRNEDSFERIQAAKVGRKRTEISGANNYLWKGGKSRGYKTGYYSTEYINWREAVFFRDDYTCQDCGTKGGYLTAHHIKSFAHYPELRFEISNGITLCEPCHSKTDNYKGRNKTGVK